VAGYGIGRRAPGPETPDDALLAEILEKQIEIDEADLER